MENEVKRLYRSNTNKILFGICGGIGEYLNIDPTVIRVLFLIGLLFSAGLLLFIYIIFLFVIPVKME